MLSRLPEYIDPLLLADKRGEVKGCLPVNTLDRLADALVINTGDVEIELIFAREGRLATIKGHLQASLELRCQNCLQALTWSVDSPVNLGVVSSIEQSNRLPETLEPLMVNVDAFGNSKVYIKDIIEDELLLLLPAYPKHQHHCLVVPDSLNGKDSSEKSGQSQKHNPFSILANFKNTGD